MNTILFEENQSFRQSWLWTMMLPAAWILLVIMLAIALLLHSMRLPVQVDTEAVRISFFPLSKKTIPLAEIVRWEARTYRPHPRTYPLRHPMFAVWQGLGAQRLRQPGRATETGERQAHPDRITASRGTGEGDWGGEGLG